MATGPVRAATDEGFAAVVLSPDLESLLWRNEAGEALVGASRPGDGGAAVLRQIVSAGSALAAKGRTQLLLRPADPTLFGPAVLARLELVEGAEAPFALLTVRQRLAAGEDAPALGARLLREAGLGDEAALAVFAGGEAVATPSLAAAEKPLLLAQGQAFLESGEESLEVSDDDGTLSFHRVARDVVVVRLGERAAAAPEPEPPVADERPAPPAGESPASPSDAAPARPAADFDGIGAVLRRWHSRGSPPPAGDVSMDAQAASDTAPAPAGKAFVARLDAEPARFVWRIDALGRFIDCPPELRNAVGPAAADIVERAFADVAAVFGFGAAGEEIARLLERRETWSGRSVLWPVEGTDRRIPVDLAALPVYGRDRRFEGFRGFGVVRPAESVADPEALGLVLVRPAAPEAPEPVAAASEAPPPASEVPVFGRRAAPPEAPAPSRAAERRAAREARLSSLEAEAFRAIGAELGGSAPVGEPPAEPEAGGLMDAFEALPLAILVQSGERLVFANRRFHDLTGYGTLDELELAGGLDHLVAACGGPDEADADGRLRHADGSQISARLHLRRVSIEGRSCLLMSFPTADAVARAADLAQQRLAEARGEVAELQAVLDTATDGILLLDEARRVRRMNGAAEALFALPSERYAGLPFSELLAPESRAHFAEYAEALRLGGMASVLNDGREVRARIGEGGLATIPLSVTLGRLGEGRGWCVVIRDTAQWKKIEGDLVTARRQAEEASLHKSRFLANVSHELRTPLNAIIGFADVMASECFGPIGHERYIEYLGDIKRSGHHVLDLVNDLLDISKIESGKIELSFEPVALNDVVAEVVSLMQPQANRERVLVRSVLPPSVPPVMADRRSVRQIALNLVANAVRFTPAGGQIIASTSHGAEGEVALRFRDSGIGMTEREIEIALAPFQQVPGTGRGGGRGEGTGLGLPLTKAMAEANRAAFRISSTPGEGTLVEIVFPADQVVPQEH